MVQGITGAQARTDVMHCLNYGAKIVAGVTPGKGGEMVNGIPVFDSVYRALQAGPVDASIIYAPPLAVKQAALEAIESGVPLVVITAEGVPLQDVSILIASARKSGTRIVGCNTNGMISPGKSKLGGIGGVNPEEIYSQGSIGICSRSGGMSAEVALALKAGGLGVSTCVSMGGDQITGTTMGEYVRMFEDDPETEAIVLFGEPGTSNESEVARLVASGQIKKPVAALIVGEFQERHPPGQSFGHAAAIVMSDADKASQKRLMLREAGVFVTEKLSDIPGFFKQALLDRASGTRVYRKAERSDVAARRVGVNP